LTEFFALDKRFAQFKRHKNVAGGLVSEAAAEVIERTRLEVPVRPSREPEKASCAEWSFAEACPGFDKVHKKLLAPRLRAL
jgi:hypothetical protein